MGDGRDVAEKLRRLAGDTIGQRNIRDLRDRGSRTPTLVGTLSICIVLFPVVLLSGVAREQIRSQHREDDCQCERREQEIFTDYEEQRKCADDEQRHRHERERAVRDEGLECAAVAPSHAFEPGLKAA